MSEVKAFAELAEVDPQYLQGLMDALALFATDWEIPPAMSLEVRTRALDFGPEVVMIVRRHNKNTDEIVQFMYAYSREALRRMRAWRTRSTLNQEAT